VRVFSSMGFVVEEPLINYGWERDPNNCGADLVYCAFNPFHVGFRAK